MISSDKKKLRVAIVGLGKMGMLHASILSVLPAVDVVAVCDKSWLMRKLAKNTLNISVTDKIDDLSDLNLDAIFVTTPIPSHYNIIKKIYNDDFVSNIFVEKTLASNYIQSRELYELSQNRKGLAMVGYMKRFSVTFNKAKELLDNRVLGDLLSFDAYAYSSDFADINDATGSIARGGVIEDLGSHIVDMALWFFGDLKVITAKTDSITPDSTDSANFELDGMNNLKGKCTVSWVKKGYRMPEFGLTITGVNGVMMVDDNELTLQLKGAQLTHWYRQDLNDAVPFLLGDPEYYREDDHFIKTIINNVRPLSNFHTAMKVDCLLDDVRLKSHE
ncbi:Gfo/Idh/MocA family oxidoreductase [Candidatus Bathycorpusculum sp.]|uniref:Gfo/Idh/MocA family protein n=1 Tax=Candidatus Bathycorpusculum sp. TaxID=2994959 RepID=UPI0028282DBB|nr:Gfo/Idh/MocA family oxidoreductase [Candidatus Termitimicrobium sp.]MCL2431585.1 Gfo/Idh/MocA family oxidoreductase [Candidatus Termitimicrobium sp.]